MPATDTTDGLTDFLAVRDRLLRIAAHIVGGASEAEDVVQDAWLRWNRTDRSVVRDAPAFLSLTTARLSVGVVQSARVRHRDAAELPTDRPEPDADPAIAVERGDGLRHAVVRLVQRLSPRERAAYVLREAFGYSHREIGDLLGLTESNARQLVRRARVRVDADAIRPASSAAEGRLLGAFLQLASTGNPRALAEVAQDTDQADGCTSGW
ncbi:RNA polymerase subunit sigma-24 [Actinoplanes sp. TBRC 11911]|uniref:sigma factor-like helix-turn-helix DNA-binding protein n=1 Tax=Actinoplanes sp. TBRC 11911 TaxID=2729386 RepID=UPI00145C9BC3|nr:sigma factor-like helix-turn-helix DNA-binding protein [Actinoplanes sp. TBRC 11911]NMO51626.1 RNA polymerase subunit sigma-24 [Actinoplanes sp. TBRC 11911]